MTTEEKISKLKETGIIPVFYHPDEEICIKVVDLCFNNNIHVFEFTNRGKNALSIFSKLRQYIKNNYPNVLLGAGTIFSLSDAETFLQEGADFIVSPILEKKLQVLHELTLYIPAGTTVNEVYKAKLGGAQLIKVFPADIVKPDFLKHVLSVLPEVKLMPTGGISFSKDDLQQWFTAGAYCLGIGSSLFKTDLLNTRNWSGLEQNLIELNQIIKSIRTK